MPPHKLKTIQEKYGLTGKHMAKLFGVSPPTISLYKGGKMKFSRTADFIERLKAFDKLAAAEQAKRIQAVLGDDASYQKSLIRQAGRTARALVEQHGYDQMEALRLAHYSRHATPLSFDIFDHISAMFAAYQKAAKNTPRITVAQLKEILKTAKRNNMPPFL